MRFISVVSGCYNEEDNIRELYDRVCRVMADELPEYAFEIVIIDNASKDGTARILREIAATDKRLKVIINNRNFGHVRSPYYGVLQAGGDAMIAMASDLEDPPEMIPQFVRKWEEGYKLVLAQKASSEESSAFSLVRKCYYFLVNRLSDVPLVKDVTGFGLYDRRVIEDMRRIGDPYPYIRGMICDLGYEQFLIPFRKPLRKRGFSKNNFYTLYDLAILGITNHSKVPLRVSVMAGVGMGILSFLVALAYLVYKLLFWNNFSVGTAPVVIGMFFLGAIQLFCIGMLGEYIGSIHTQVLKRPLVIEKERINFDSGPVG
uniref:Glycosyl transferase, family 2 n=1 Tax=Solibacter usitatus (strain Ellin6076) TaxID=234267 RepID=Q025U3_SOLUE